MPFLIGTDEAGYGPNLGPLVVGATVWQTPPRTMPEDLYRLLEGCVCCQPGDQRLAIADSKALYKPGLGLGGLERVVLAIFALRGQPVCDWPSLWRNLAGIDASDLRCHAWHDGVEIDLPQDVTVAELNATARSLEAGLRQAELEIAAVQARAVFPDRFNGEVRRCGNKAEVLSLTTLRLVAELAEQIPDGNDVIVICDKHGGRDYYAALIQHVFPETWVRVVRDGAGESIYRFRLGCRPVEIRFLMGGERMLPTALASMTAKYLREIAMIPFNGFWQRQVPGLKATAGYPGDSRRFLADIRPACRKLQIAEETFWRSV